MLNRGSICFFFFTFFFFFGENIFRVNFRCAAPCMPTRCSPSLHQAEPRKVNFCATSVCSTCVCKLATNRLLFFLRCCFGGNSRCLSAAVKCFRCKQRELNLGKQTLEGTFWLTKYERWLSQSGR